MKTVPWMLILTIVLALIAGGLAYGALDQMVRVNSRQIELLALEHRKTLEIIAQLDKNQALLSLRLESLMIERKKHD